MDVVPQAIPLLEEQILQVGEEIHVLLQQRTVLLRRALLPQADVVRPLRPRLHAEMALAGHEQGVVRQPTGIGRGKGGHRLAVPLPAPLECLMQQVKPLLVDAAVVHVAGVAAPLAAAALALGQQAVGDEQLGVDEIGIARVGGKALVRRIAIAGGPQRQHLPVALARCLQEVREVVGRLSQRADPVGGGQGGDGHQNTTGTFHSSTSLSFRDKQSYAGRAKCPPRCIDRCAVSP